MNVFVVLVAVFIVLVICRKIITLTYSRKLRQYLKEKRFDDNQNIGETTLKLEISDQIELENLFRNKRK